MTTTTNAASAADAPAPVPALGEAGFTPHPHDEDAELAAIEAEAEKAPAAGEGEQPVAEGARPAAPAVDEGKPAREPTIPKARFDEAVLRERERGIAAAAFWRGKAEALAEVAARGGKAGEPEPTPEQEAAQLEAAVDQKAVDFDEGRISMAELKRFERQANQRLATLRAAPAPEAGASGDMRLEELTAALPERFPVLDTLMGAEVARLLPIARAELQYEGVDPAGGPRSDYLLRERVAQLAQARFGEGTQQSRQPSTTTPPTGRDLTKAARDKLALAGRMPPTLNKSGTAQVPQDAYSPDRIESMDLDELATAVPETVLRRLSSQ